MKEEKTICKNPESKEAEIPVGELIGKKRTQD